MKEFEYLTEKELDALIKDIETHDLIATPPDFGENVLRKAVGVKEDIKGRKQREFRNYCLRVIASAAAAIIVLFTLPGLANERLEIGTKDMVLAGQNVKTKEEILKGHGGILKTIGSSHYLEDALYVYFFE